MPPVKRNYFLTVHRFYCIENIQLLGNKKIVEPRGSKRIRNEKKIGLSIIRQVSDHLPSEVHSIFQNF